MFNYSQLFVLILKQALSIENFIDIYLFKRGLLQEAYSHLNIKKKITFRMT